jgi:uncharacterized membrane protein YecN with MAPEG domain
MLFITALSALAIAATESSAGWLVGGILLFAVAIFALRQFKKEAKTEREGASGHFVAWAFFFFIVAILLLIWLQSSA